MVSFLVWIFNLKILIILLFSSSLLHADLKMSNLSFRGGITFASGQAVTKDIDDDDEEEITGFGAGFNTYFTYIDKYWEYSLSSYTYFGQVKKYNVNLPFLKARGDGYVTNTSFGPTATYHFHHRLLTYKGWHPYVTVGVIWSLQTIKFKDFYLKEGELDDSKKITFWARGPIAGLGITEKRSENARFIEFLTTYQYAYRASYVDLSDFKEVKTINQTNLQKLYMGLTFMLNIGMTIF